MRYNSDAGAMLIEATADQIAFQFITRRGELIDSTTIDASGRAGSALTKPRRSNLFLRRSQSRVE